MPTIAPRFDDLPSSARTASPASATPNGASATRRAPWCACTASRATAATSTSSRSASSSAARAWSRRTCRAAAAANCCAPARTTPTPLYLTAMAALIARLDVERGRLGRHVARRPHRHGARGAAEQRPIRRLVLNDFGARIPVAALQRIGAYLRQARASTTLEEVEAHLREIHAPFGELTDAQWRHMARARRRAGRGRLSPALRSRRSSSSSRVRCCSTSCCGASGSRSTCPTLILRGDDSDLLLAATVGRDAQARRRRRAGPGRVGRDRRMRPRAGADGRRPDRRSSPTSSSPTACAAEARVARAEGAPR